ncbi:MAG: translation elongation factor 4, partial [Bacteriovoracaceae bacterium]
KKEIEDVIGLDASEAPLVSGKSGLGVDGLLEEIVKKIPPPTGKVNSPLQALIFDSWFDPYRGVVVLARIMEGTLKVKDKIHFKFSSQDYEVIKLAVHTPFYNEVNELAAGEVGMIVCGIKTVRDVKVGDTIVHTTQKDTPSLAGYKDIKPMVFCGIFPVDSEEYEILKEALEKLALNDASFTYEPEVSQALGFGFRCGFLGLLHMDIIQTRLEREFNLALISTAPSCSYHVITQGGEKIIVDNPAKLPDPTFIDQILEPTVKLSIHLPNEFVGKIIKLCEDRRGQQQNINYITEDRVQLIYILPLSEMMFDFYDQLKSLSKGYASMDYELHEYMESDMCKLDVLLNGDKVDALSVITHKSTAQQKGKDLTHRLLKVIDRQQFDIAIQAAIGSKVVARETVKALRKNVLAKCYGGDVSRKRKLLEKQKEGKKRMKMVGNVEIPQEAFLAVLKTEE